MQQLWFLQSESMISQKGLYGMVSGSITTALLQPFENIKMALIIPPYKLVQSHSKNNVFHNVKTSCQYIYSHDGIPGFYKGLNAAILKASLGCYIYFAGLRAFERQQMSPYQNFAVSSISRIASTFLTNPLSIIQTRFELAYFDQYKDIKSAVVDIYRKEGFRGFFSGGLTSCIKEGAFGGFHYMFYEELKILGFNKAAAGVISGLLATIVTHPFELIRAKLQTMGLYQKKTKHMILGELKKLKKTGGWTLGLAPRLVKKPISNTLTFLMFQILEDSKRNTLL